MTDSADVENELHKHLLEAASDSFLENNRNQEQNNRIAVSKSDGISVSRTPSGLSFGAHDEDTTMRGKRMSSQTQDLRSLDKSNPANVSKEQPSKDPISQSLLCSVG